MANLGTKPTKGRKNLAIKIATIPWLAQPLPHGAKQLPAGGAASGGGVTVR